MKVFKGILVAAVATSVLASCQNDDLQTTDGVVTEAQAAEFFNNSIQLNSGGLLTNSRNVINTALKLTNKNSFDCSKDYTDDYNFNYNGIWIDSSYSSNYDLDFSCSDQNLPTSVAVKVTTDYLYKSTNIDATSKGDFTASITGLAEDLDEVVLNGSYTHTGKSTFEYFGGNEYNNKTTMNLTSLTFDKGNVKLGVKPKLKYGEGTINYVFTSQSGIDYKFDGKLEFLEDKKGIITINNNVYPFNW